MLAYGLPDIPAMTTEAERHAYYNLAKVKVREGEIVELGAWLGASTVAIAAGIRDSGVEGKVRVWDRFVWKPAAHEPKAGGPLIGSMFEQFKKNVAPLVQFVDANPGEIAKIKWTGHPIALMVIDAPKRVPEIAAVLTEFGPHVKRGAVMVWQDFCHFPSYAIPACLYRLKSKIKFVEAVVPGETVITEVVEPWQKVNVSERVLSLGTWGADAVANAWAYWRSQLPPAKHAMFDGGEAMFLCDLGRVDLACAKLREALSRDSDEAKDKWREIRDTRAGLVKRYRPLFDELRKMGV